MKLIAPNSEGVFTFNIEEHGREVIFVNSQAVVADIENNHCSNHYANMSGCSDCEIVTLFNALTDNEFEKSAKNPYFKYTVDIKSPIAPLTIEPRNPSPRTQLIQQQFARMIAVFFAGAKVDAGKAAAKASRKLFKTEEDERKIALAAYLAITWTDLFNSTLVSLMAAYQTGVMEAFNQLGLEVNNDLQNAASEYASDRAAEMIGKKIVDTKFVDNAEAKYVIAETTKDDLVDVVEEAISKKMTPAEIEEQITLAATFSDLRARFIADNEIAVAQTQGHLAAWRYSQKVTKVNVVLGPLHTVTDECDKHASGSPYDIDKVPAIPAHPYCACTLQAFEE